MTITIGIVSLNSDPLKSDVNVSVNNIQKNLDIDVQPLITEVTPIIIDNTDLIDNNNQINLDDLGVNNKVTSITIGGQQLVVGTIVTPTTYTQVGSIITLPPNTFNSQIILFFQPNLQTNEVSIDLGSLGQFNILNLSVTRSFKGIPSARVTIVDSPENIDIFNNLKKDPNLTIPFLGIEWLLSDISYTRLNNLEVPGNFVAANISFVGKFSQKGNISSNKLDVGVPLNRLGKPGATYNISALAGATGTPYVGSNIQIDIPKNTTNAFTTLRREVESRAITVRGFVYYSDSALRIKRWLQEVTTHFIDTSEILNWSENYKGLGETVDCIRLNDQYRNTRLSIKKDTEEFSDDEIICLTEFENADDDSDLISPPSGNLNTEREKLRTTSANFDSGGETKTKRVICTQNGSEISITETVYGYSYTSGDTHIITFNNNELSIVFDTRLDPRQFWGIVSESKTTYFYGSDNYLKRISKQGQRQFRFRQESGGREVADLVGQRLIVISDGNNDLVGDIDKQINLLTAVNRFTFSSQLITSKLAPINEVTSFIHARFREFYSDINIPNEGQEDDFIEPKFVLRKIVSRNEIQRIEDPLNTPENPLPDIIFADSFLEVEQTQIIIPTSNTATKKKPEKFRVIVSRRSSTGENSNNQLKIASASERKGRPSIAKLLKTNTKDNNNNRNIPTEGQGDVKYLLYTINQQNIGFRGIEENSVSYPDIYDPIEGLKIAKTDIDIKNSSVCKVVTLSLHLPRTEINEGDIVIFEGERYFVLSINQTYDVNKVGVLFSSNFTIKLGLVLDLRVTMNTISTETVNGKVTSRLTSSVTV